ncbi:hypothetical protein ACFYNL_06255 [Streptomyces sp. NPDC007808]|uniref:hypothetical protein n=1 Tax=Streptomyces sp. NPDC007808 TaxID=3364779 RepID=UPI003696BB39
MQQRDPLVERELPEQVVDALVDRQYRVEERKPGGGQGRRTHEENPLSRLVASSRSASTLAPLRQAVNDLSQ